MDLPWNLCPYCAMPVEGMRLAEPDTIPSQAQQIETPLSS
jgi:hypothetical protein